MPHSKLEIILQKPHPPQQLLLQKRENSSSGESPETDSEVLSQNKINQVGWWWHTTLIPALGRQRQVDLCEFQVSLGYRTNSRTARAVTQEKPCGGEEGIST